MKVYYAGSSKGLITAKQRMQELRDLGHTITYDWTTDVDHWLEKGGSERKFGQPVEDMAGILKANLFIIDRSCDSGGALIEAGMALQAGVRVKSIGTLHPVFGALVDEYDSWKELLESIAGTKTYTVTVDGLGTEGVFGPTLDKEGCYDFVGATSLGLTYVNKNEALYLWEWERGTKTLLMHFKGAGK